MLYLSECPVISNKELESIIIIAAFVEDREESHPRLKRERISFECHCYTFPNLRKKPLKCLWAPRRK